MRLHSYVVARDYGFAPNPFGNCCTLATCKPLIRKLARVGDWIVGLACADDSGDTPRIVYAMKVEETLTYNEYWNDSRFQFKNPSRTSSVKCLMGDNIYFRSNGGQWHQADSHHSFDDGSVNMRNVENDTQADRVLISWTYAYWGSQAIPVPKQFLDFRGETIVVKRGHHNRFSKEFVDAFALWFAGQPARGYIAEPFRWTNPRATWARYQGSL